jgi:hypothetical protein
VLQFLGRALGWGVPGADGTLHRAQRTCSTSRSGSHRSASFWPSVGPVGLDLHRTLFFVRAASEILRAFTAVFRGLGFDVFYIDLGGLRSTVLRDNESRTTCPSRRRSTMRRERYLTSSGLLGVVRFFIFHPSRSQAAHSFMTAVYKNQPDREHTYMGDVTHM